jgi:hypothetical protein
LQSRHETAVRSIPKLWSCIATMFSGAIGCQKLGHPVPDSNLVSELKTAVSQQIQRYRPWSCRFQVLPVYARSVPSWRVTSNETGGSCRRHSASDLIVRGTVTFPILLPSGENWTMVTEPAETLLPLASTVASEGRCNDQRAAAPHAPAATINVRRLERENEPFALFPADCFCVLFSMTTPPLRFAMAGNTPIQTSLCHARPHRRPYHDSHLGPCHRLIRKRINLPLFAGPGS